MLGDQGFDGFLPGAVQRARVGVQQDEGVVVHQLLAGGGQLGDNGITLAITGEQTPEEAMVDAAEQIRALILGALAGMVNVPGSYQDQAGCGASWDPACEATAMELGDDGLYRLVSEAGEIAAGDYEFKIALDGSWAVNYGSDGELDGPNYTISVPENATVTLIYDPETHLVEIVME